MERGRKRRRRRKEEKEEEEEFICQVNVRIPYCTTIL